MQESGGSVRAGESLRDAASRMIILHGALLGRSPLRLGRGASRGRGEAPAARTARAALSLRRRLRGALARRSRVSASIRPPDASREESATAWLPTVSDQPFPSSALIGESPGRRGRGRHRAMARLRAAARGRPNRSTCCRPTPARSQHGVIAGRDLRFWILALRRGGLAGDAPALPARHGRAGGQLARALAAGLARRGRRAARGARARHAGRRARADAPAGGAVRPTRRRVARSRPSSAPPSTSSCARTRTTALPVVVGNGACRGQRGPSAGSRALRAPDERGDGRSPSRSRQLADLVARLAAADRRRSPPRRSGCASGWRSRRRPRTSRQPRRGRRATARRARRARRRAPGQRRWYVRFLLQSADDPNLLVPTADAWIIRGRKAAALARSGTDCTPTLLASMVQAAGRRAAHRGEPALAQAVGLLARRARRARVPDPHRARARSRRASA